MQQWFNQSDQATEETLSDVPLYREYALLDSGLIRLPDETSILRLQHLLETHKLARRTRHRPLPFCLDLRFRPVVAARGFRSDFNRAANGHPFCRCALLPRPNYSMLRGNVGGQSPVRLVTYLHQKPSCFTQYFAVQCRGTTRIHVPRVRRDSESMGKAVAKL